MTHEQAIVIDSVIYATGVITIVIAVLSGLWFVGVGAARAWQTWNELWIRGEAATWRAANGFEIPFDQEIPYRIDPFKHWQH